MKREFILSADGDKSNFPKCGHYSFLLTQSKPLCRLYLSGEKMTKKRFIPKEVAIF